jgi:hypothetical protein
MLSQISKGSKSIANGCPSKWRQRLGYNFALLVDELAVVVHAKAAAVAPLAVVRARGAHNVALRAVAVAFRNAVVAPVAHTCA